MYRESASYSRGGGHVQRDPHQERAEAYYAGSRSGPKLPSRQKKQSPSTKVYKQVKEDKFRMGKGTKVLESYQADLKKSLLCGFESMEEVLKAKEYENSSRNVCIPVATRAVGFSTVTTFNKLTAVEVNRQRLPDMTMFQLYRVI